MSNAVLDQERIVGFEMEYSPSISIVDPTGNDPRIVEQVSVLEDIYDEYDAVDNGFLENGFRAYEDRESDEVCTPESYPDDVGMLQLISEDIVLKALVKRVDYLDRYYPVAGKRHPLLPLRSSDEFLSSGYHENYQSFTPNLFQKYKIINCLDYFAATQSIFTGQGIVMVDKADDGSQRGEFLIAQKVGMSTIGSDRFVESAGFNDRIQGYMRYELRRNNYPVSQWQLKYRAAYTSAFIRALELGGITTDDMVLEEEPYFVQLALADNPEVKHVMHATYKKVTAAEYQLAVAEKVLKLAESHGFPDYEIEAAVEVATILAHLKDKNYEAVALQVPWILKKRKIISRLPNFFDGASDTADIALANQICLSLDSRGPGTALDLIRSRQGLYTPEAIDAAKENLPCLEVAKQRGRNIAENQRAHSNRGYDALWMSDRLELAD